MWCTELISIHGTLARERFLRASIYAFVYIFGVNLFIVCPSLRSVSRVSRVYWHRPLVFMLFWIRKVNMVRERSKTLSCFRDGDWRSGNKEDLCGLRCSTAGLDCDEEETRISRRMTGLNRTLTTSRFKSGQQTPAMQISCKKNTVNKKIYDPLKTRNQRKWERSKKLHFDERKTTKNI